MIARAPIVLIVGPRQCGKTTMAREIAARCRCTSTATVADLP